MVTAGQDTALLTHPLIAEDITELIGRVRDEGSSNARTVFSAFW